MASSSVVTTSGSVVVNVLKRNVLKQAAVTDMIAVQCRRTFATSQEATEQKVAAAADDVEPHGKAPEGHGFEENSSINEERFAGEHRAYGKIQEHPEKVAEKSKGIKMESSMEEETLENTGYDLSNRTAPHGGE